MKHCATDGGCCSSSLSLQHLDPMALRLCVLNFSHPVCSCTSETLDWGSCNYSLFCAWQNIWFCVQKCVLQKKNIMPIILGKVKYSTENRCEYWCIYHATKLISELLNFHMKNLCCFVREFSCVILSKE